MIGRRRAILSRGPGLARWRLLFFVQWGGAMRCGSGMRRWSNGRSVDRYRMHRARDDRVDRRRVYLRGDMRLWGGHAPGLPEPVLRISPELHPDRPDDPLRRGSEAPETPRAPLGPRHADRRSRVWVPPVRAALGSRAQVPLLRTPRPARAGLGLQVQAQRRHARARWHRVPGRRPGR